MKSFCLNCIYSRNSSGNVLSMDDICSYTCTNKKAMGIVRGYHMVGGFYPTLETECVYYKSNNKIIFPSLDEKDLKTVFG